MARIYYTTGYTEVTEPKNGTDFTAEELNRIVNGYIDLIDLGDFYMVVNEDGYALKLHGNLYASLLARQMIVGNAVVVKKSQIK